MARAGEDSWDGREAFARPSDLDAVPSGVVPNSRELELTETCEARAPLAPAERSRFIYEVAVAPGDGNGVASPPRELLVPCEVRRACPIASPCNR